MSMKSIALASVAIVALAAGASVAQADDQDDEVRALNIQQLEKAGGDASDVTAPSPAAEQDGQGGPDLQGPPTPDDGMTDDEPADEPVTDDEADEPEADDPADQPSPQPE